MTLKNAALFLFLALFLTAFTANQAQDGKTKTGCSTEEKKSCGSGETSCQKSCGGDEVQPTKENTKQVDIWNTVCPIKGDKINPKAPTYTYNGKVYGFCCKGCDETFKKDPAKYSKNLSSDGKTFVGKK